MKPVRLQLKRIKGFNLQDLSRSTNGLEAVVVSRPSRWGNPYKVDEYDPDYGSIDREFAMELYQEFYESSDLFKYIYQLKGKNLACWCPLDQPCHADILLEVANA